MLSNFHRTTSEHWWRTPGTQKCSPFSSKEVGKNIKDKKRDKRVRDRDLAQEGSREGGEVCKCQKTLTGRSVGKLWNLRGQHNWGGREGNTAHRIHT